MSIQSTSGDSVIFREQFISPASVAANGGVVTGTPVVNKSIKTVSTDLVNYSALKRFPTLVGVSVRWKGSVNWTNSDGYAGLFTVSNNSAAAAGVYFGIYRDAANNRFLFNVADGTNYKQRPHAIIPANDTVFEFVGTYDGTNVNVYINGVLDNGTQSGTLTGSLPLGRLAQTVLFNRLSTSIWGFNQRGNFVEVYDKALTAEEVKDLYEQDTIQELDKPLIDLPLRSSYYKENGVEILTDPDFDNTTIDDWEASSTAVALSLSTDSPKTGTQALRITYVTGHGYARRVGLTSTRRYRFKGWARGDGGAFFPRITDHGGTIFWQGTTSTSWQYFDVEFTGASWVVLYTPLTGGGVGSWIEFDNLSLELMENLTENKGTLGGTAKLGDGFTPTTMPTLLAPHGASFDGGDSIDLNNEVLTLSSQAFSFGCLLFDPSGLSDVSNPSLLGTWDGAQTKGVLIYKYPSVANGFGLLIGSSSGNLLEARGDACPRGLHSFFATYSGSGTYAGLKLYIDGKLSTWTNGSAGTLASNISTGRNLLLGARHNGASRGNFLTANKRVYFPKFYLNEFTARQVKILHNRLMKGLNV
jgi:hypothetical protein